MLDCRFLYSRGTPLATSLCRCLFCHHHFGFERFSRTLFTKQNRHTYLDRFTGGAVCSKQLFREALNRPFDEPKQWEIREVNDIMNHCITGWRYFSNPRIFEGYGRQKGWEREAPATGADNGPEKMPDGFVEVTEQMELPF